MTKKSSIEHLLKLTSSYMKDDELSLISEAHAFAKKVHAGQFRKSKKPYIVHVVSVAIILAELHQDSKTICAGLLHDTIEDTQTTKETLVPLFGEDIAFLVEGVTKLGHIYFGTDVEHQGENFRKMFLAMAEDLRVVIIKLADRLHNMRTLRYLPREKQKRISIETKDIFAPLAHRLGIGSLKWELEDLAFNYLQPIEFQKVKKLVAESREEREKYLEVLIKKIQEDLITVDIKARIEGRPKSFFSIFKKLISQNTSTTQLFDLLGIRIIVEDIKECYEVLGHVHALYKPIYGRFKDYIAMPKSNLYQSLHTTVIAHQGKPVEIQIRTEDMDQISEYGFASHWRYKEISAHTSFDDNFNWLREIIESQKEETGPKFMESIKLDLFLDEVFIFTPKGAIRSLHVGATPLDFAFKIHTDIGYHCVGAKVNGVIKPLDYTLQNGDQVEILTSDKQFPKTAWLKIVKTNHAQSKIKYWLRKQSHTKTIEKGKQDIERLIKVSGHPIKKALSKKTLPPFLKKYNYKKSEDFYLAVAQGDFSAQKFIRYLDTLFPPDPAEMPKEFVSEVKAKMPKEGSTYGIRVLGEKNIAVNLAKCCLPIPGDDIIGFVTKGWGVSIHRSDCPNIIKIDKEHSQRLVSVEWEPTETIDIHQATIVIEAFDRLGLLKDILNQISESKINIQQVSSDSRKDSAVRIDIILDIKNLNQLKSAISAIRSISDVYSVSRITR